MAVGLFNEQLTNMEDRELLQRMAASLKFSCCKTAVQNAHRVDAVSACSNYDRLIRQGKKYIEEFRRNGLLAELALGEDKTISDTADKCLRILHRHILAAVRSLFQTNRRVP